jgi:hypothetical protein
MISACLNNPVVATAVGSSVLYGSCYLLDKLYGPGEHTSSFSIPVFNNTFFGVTGALTAELKSSLGKAAEGIPKLASQLCLRLDLQ